MDVRLREARPSDEERAAIDGLLGPPTSAWEGGARGSPRDAHSSHGGRAQRERRHLLLPALQSLQSRVGWISEGGLNYVCERLSVPPAEAWSVATFYAMLATTPRPRRVVHVCDDIACRARGARELCDGLEREVGPAHHAPAGDHAHHDADRPAWMRSPCLGLCEAAPAVLITEAGERPVERQLAGATVDHVRALLDGGTPAADGALEPVIPQRGDPSLVLLRRVGVVDPTDLAAYREAGGYRALQRAFEIGAKAVIRELTDAQLVGRGGAAFPIGLKWDAARWQPARPHYLVCNADESEPGTFKDRVLLCGDPFAVVEAMTIAAFATDCEQAFVYVRAEYPLSYQRMRHAVEAARDAGLLGDRIQGRDFSFDIEIRRGSGAYICGEETALFESIEGRRGEPRKKPPYPVEQGLFGKPTVVNNVETLVNVLGIVLEGGAAYARTGTARSTGTRLFCVSGNVRTPGIYEVPLGTRLRALIDLAGGVNDSRRVKAVLLGGAAGTFLGPDELDLPLTHEDARAAGTTLGSGVVMVFDDTVDLKDIVLRIASFFRDESCGQCVPCRVGTVRQQEALERLAGGSARGGAPTELVLIDEIGTAMRDASICGLGQTAYAAVESAIKRLRLFGDPPPPAATVAAGSRPVAATAAPAPGSSLTGTLASAPAAARSIQASLRTRYAGAPRLRSPRSPGSEDPGAGVTGPANDDVGLTIDGRAVSVPKGTSLLDACRSAGIDVPTLCYLETLEPANACRLCVVEIEGSRVLAPSCSRAVEAGMKVHTDSDRVRHSRRLVLEMLASSVDLSVAPDLQRRMREYDARPDRQGPPAPAGGHHREPPGHHAPFDPRWAATVAQAVKIDNDLYVRDYSKCVLCYKCVQACGEDHQNTFAIAVAGRGFGAHIATEFDVPLTDSACVYCGNCIAVCPTGALMAKSEFDLRSAGAWDESKQTTTDTICPYCGVGCTLTLHVQDGRIVKATSPLDASITLGNLCIKGRFGWRFVQPEGAGRSGG